LVVTFGDPIPANNFLEENKENPNAAALSMRNSIYDGIDPLIINIRSKNYYNDFVQIYETYGRHFLTRQNQKYSIVNLFQSNQKLTRKLDELEAENPKEIELLVKDVNDYNTLLKKHKVRNWLVEKPQNNFWRIALNILILLAGLPIFVYGFLFNAIPFFTIDTVLRKKFKDITFWSSFSLGLGMFLFPIIYLLELFAMSWIIPGVWFKLAFIVSLPFAGKLAFKWYILFRKTAGRSRLLLLQLFSNGKYNQLLISKEKLFSKIDNLISTEI
jgi:hypothetical protein